MIEQTHSAQAMSGWTWTVTAVNPDTGEESMIVRTSAEFTPDFPEAKRDVIADILGYIMEAVEMISQ